MAAESAIIGLLKADSGVSALVAERVYPYILPQSYALPAITVESDIVDPVHHKDGQSTENYEYVIVTGFTGNTVELQGLREATRTALDFKFKTETIVKNVKVQFCRLMSDQADKENLTNKEIFFFEQRYMVRTRI